MVSRFKEEKIMLNDKNSLLIDLLTSSDEVEYIAYSTDIKELNDNQVVVDLKNGKSFKITIEEYQ
jgi:hypothetical protein